MRALYCSFLLAGPATSQLLLPRESSSAATGFGDRSNRDSKTKVGIGLEYEYSGALAFRAEWEQARLPVNQITDSKVNLASGGD